MPLHGLSGASPIIIPEPPSGGAFGYDYPSLSNLTVLWQAERETGFSDGTEVLPNDYESTLGAEQATTSKRPTWEDDHFNTGTRDAFVFAAASDWLDFVGNLPITTTGTAVCVFKATAVSAKVLACWETGGEFYHLISVNGSGNARARIGSADAVHSSGHDFVANWGHYVVTWDTGGNVLLYVNGSLVDTEAFTGTLPSDANNTPVVGGERKDAADPENSSIKGFEMAVLAIYSDVKDGTTIGDMWAADETYYGL